jgi:hypothetical protein
MLGSTEFKQIIDICESEGLAVDRSDLPSLEDYELGGEAEFEFSFIYSLIEANPKRGDTIWSGLDHEEGNDENYLGLLKQLVLLSSGDVELEEALSTIDKSGNETVVCKIHGNEYRWSGNSWDKYLDLSIFESMVTTLNGEAEGMYYLASLENEEIPILYCTKKACTAINKIWSNDDKGEEPSGIKYQDFDWDLLGEEEQFYFESYRKYRESTFLYELCTENGRSVANKLKVVIDLFESQGQIYIDRGKSLLQAGVDGVSSEELSGYFEYLIVGAIRPMEKLDDSTMIYLCNSKAKSLEKLVDKLSS